MDKIRVLFDKEGNTLDVWFGEPRKAICEETGDEVIIKKDIKTGKVIGFEKLNMFPTLKKKGSVPIEVVVG